MPAARRGADQNLRHALAPHRRRQHTCGMVSLAALWLPILLSAVAVFVVSSVLHMCLPLHKSDYKKVPGEDAVLTALRAQNVSAGAYMFPHANSMKEAGSPEMMAKRKKGPVGTLVVVGNFAMGKSLGQWFVFSLAISFFVAYLATMALPLGAAFAAVFRFAGAAAVLGYAFTDVTNSIWKGVAWSTALKFVFDGVLYGLATGAVFAWLWPTTA